MLFYLKTTEKRYDPPEYRFEIIFLFNSSTPTEMNSSTILNDPNIPTEMKESSDNKHAKGKNKVHGQPDENSIAAEEITPPHEKRSLFQPSNVPIEAESKPKKRLTWAIKLMIKPL